MTNKDFDPAKFIDREFEQELFENLLELKGPARVLAIRDQGGMGKTHLLERFQYRCRVARPNRLPVCLLSLDDFSGDAILPLIQAMERQLNTFNLEFPGFRRLEHARMSADFSFIRSTVHLQEARFDGAKDFRISGTMFNSEHIERLSVNLNQIELTPEQQVVAQDVSVKTFFDDLHEHCSRRSIVILIDGYEKASEGIRHWIDDILLEQFFFDIERRPAALILVVAGRTMPLFQHRWSVEECASVVCTVQQLGRWERRHIEDCLRVHGLAYEVADLDSFYRLVERGIPPSQIVHLIRMMLPTREV